MIEKAKVIKWAVGVLWVDFMIVQRVFINKFSSPLSQLLDDGVSIEIFATCIPLQQYYIPRQIRGTVSHLSRYVLCIPGMFEKSYQAQAIKKAFKHALKRFLQQTVKIKVLLPDLILYLYEKTVVYYGIHFSKLW